jgi:hypothetical protein
MMQLCRFIGLVLVATAGLRAEPPGASEPSGKIQPVKAEITGDGFEFQEMRAKAVAFSMRHYVWSNVPPGIDGLLYTQMAGGGTATIHLKAKEAGRVFVAVAANHMLDLKEKGWTLPMPDRSNTFSYNDVNQTMMVILSREVGKGEELDIPQLGWTGTIILLPTDF